jgi:hypothetical protein
MRTFLVVCTFATFACASCAAAEPDPYGANGPCAYLFKQPGGNCLDGVFTLETEVGLNQQIVSSKVISSSASAASSGSVTPIAQCVADNMAFYAKWHVKDRDTPGKQTVTIHVVNANTCVKP